MSQRPKHRGRARATLKEGSREGGAQGGGGEGSETGQGDRPSLCRGVGLQEEHAGVAGGDAIARRALVLRALRVAVRALLQQQVVAAEGAAVQRLPAAHLLPRGDDDDEAQCAVLRTAHAPRGSELRTRRKRPNADNAGASTV